MMGRTWLSIPVGKTGIRVGRSVADSELRGQLPGWRRYELCHGLIKAAEARGEKMTKDEAAYIVDKALASGLLSSSGDLNFHMRGKYMPLYIAEFQFRYNNRENTDIFGTAI
jgi:hypothetical protein